MATTTRPEPRWDGDGLNNKASALATIDCSKEPSITNQSDKNATDINRIINNYLKGNLSELPHREGIYTDVSEIGDYRDVRERIRHFNEYFDALPALVRERFRNDPANLAESMGDPTQLDLLTELGIYKAESTPPAPGATPPTPPPAPPAP